MVFKFISKTFFLFLAFTSFFTTEVLASDVREEWKDFWTRCRLAVENSEKLDVTDLKQVVVPGKQNDHPRQIAWGNDKNRFVIIDSVSNTPINGHMRNCKVELSSNSKPLSDVEEGMLVHTFLIERNILIGNGTHVRRNPVSLPFLIGLGVGLKSRNPYGCRVISTLFFERTRKFFTSSTGNQNYIVAKGKCGPHLLKKKPDHD